MGSGGLWDDPEEGDDWDYTLHKDWDGSHCFRWSMWDISRDGEVTIVGIQKGNTLTYCAELEGDCYKDYVVDKAEFEAEPSENGIGVKIVLIAFALLFVILGIRSMKIKNKKQGK